MNMMRFQLFQELHGGSGCLHNEHVRDTCIDQVAKTLPMTI